MKNIKMKKKKVSVVLSFVVLFFVISCTSNKKTEGELPCIDVTKKYPEKEIYLKDLADVSYVYLDSKSNDYLFKGSVSYSTKNTIVVIDQSSYSILFFSKDGVPKSRFCHYGNGPEEYEDLDFVMYDEEKDDVYVTPMFGIYTNVYSSTGEYKRRLTFPGHKMALFDEESIIVYDNTKLWRSIVDTYYKRKSTFAGEVGDSSFYICSRTDGKVLKYLHIPNKKIDISVKDPKGAFFGQAGFSRIRKAPGGFFLYNPERDTVFFYGKDKILTPYFCKKPLLSEYSPRIVMDICMDAGGFQFLTTYRFLKTGQYAPPEYYMRDKKTGEIFRQKLRLSDYKGRDFYIDPFFSFYDENEIYLDVSLEELQEAYHQNKLSGKLKDLVASHIEDLEGNNIQVFLDFHH